MSLSIKQKQVLGVTSIVVLVVVVLSLLHMTSLVRVLLQQSQARAEALAMAVYQTASKVVTSHDAAYDELRRDPAVQAALESALYSDNVTYAAIVDTSGMVIAHNDRARIGERLPQGDDLAALVRANRLEQLRAVYSTDRMLEWRQPIVTANDVPFAEIRIGLSTLLVRNELDKWLWPAALTAAIALLAAVAVAVLLSHIVLRPIHVIRSGLSRLGQGDLGATLELEGDEFKDLGDIFASVSNQLKNTLPAGAPRSQLLELSRRVASLGRLTAGVAHEVKNPLNAMTIHLELLKQKLAAGANGNAGDHVEIIGSEIRRLDDVVQGFLKFARPEELALQPVSTMELARDVLKMIEPEARAANITLETDCAPDVPPIEADASILRQALVNLAKNAIQAMPEGGRLRVACAATKDGRVEIRVADSGVGIPPENLAKIFDLYFTTKQTGTGIGLSLVYRTIQLHSGDIDVESTPGAGTTFIIKMPQARTTTPTPKSSNLTDLRKVENL